MIDFKCPKCGEEMNVPDSLGGQSETCPSCGNVTIVPMLTKSQVDTLAALGNARSSTRPLPRGRRGPKRPRGRKQCPKCREWIDKRATKCPHCRSKQPTPAWATVTALIVVVIIGAWGYRSCSSGTDSPQGREDKGPSRSHTRGLTYDPSFGLPKYEVFDRKVYDTPIKTQVQIDLLVTENLTPKALRNLLAKVFLETDKQRGFKYHPTPTHVFIYAYPDKERAESGSGGWAAMLSKVGKHGHPDVDVNDRLLAALKEKPVEKFGLSEAKRREVWTQLVRAEDRAMKEAEAKYPLEPHKALKVGQEMVLTKQTPLMPDLEPSIAALSRIRRLPTGASIRVLRVAKKSFAPWYQVVARSPGGSSLGTGWINSMALSGQIKVNGREQLGKQADYQRNLKDQCETQIAKDYGLTEEQLNAISVEGIKKQWPMPNVPED